MRRTYLSELSAELADRVLHASPAPDQTCQNGPYHRMLFYNVALRAPRLRRVLRPGTHAYARVQTLLPHVRRGRCGRVYDEAI